MQGGEGEGRGGGRERGGRGTLIFSFPTLSPFIAPATEDKLIFLSRFLIRLKYYDNKYICIITAWQIKFLVMVFVCKKRKINDSEIYTLDYYKVYFNYFATQ